MFGQIETAPNLWIACILRAICVSCSTLPESLTLETGTMTLAKRLLLTAAALTLSLHASFGQAPKTDRAAAKDPPKKADQKWDVSVKHGPSTDIEFDTDEGTWISVDVSPDGKQVVFDLLADIYFFPLPGGGADARARGGAP